MRGEVERGKKITISGLVYNKKKIKGKEGNKGELAP